ncbi:MAG TPA: signal peptidase I [Steroidobacteraceae bacterium]|jgi:signal peptidase I|nr:signal peptidase I [Steroidobacteraceae bacterium]
MSASRASQLFREYRGLILFIGLMLIFRSACADWMTVPTGSMNPTIVEGDRIFVNKHAYGWRIPFTFTRITNGADPKRGEIAVFYSPLATNGIPLVKRVIGVPGDTVEMRDEVLYINGQPQHYERDTHSHDLLNTTARLDHVFYTEELATPHNAVDHSVMFLPDRMAMRNFGPVNVTAGHYLMLGDNRDNSGDSRYIGLVPRRNFVGRASEVVVSLNPEKWYLPRIDRIWVPLI